MAVQMPPADTNPEYVERSSRKKKLRVVQKSPTTKMNSMATDRLSVKVVVHRSRYMMMGPISRMMLQFMMQISLSPKIMSSVLLGKNQRPDCMVTPRMKIRRSMSESRVTTAPLRDLSITAVFLKRKKEAICDDKSIMRSAAGMRTMKNDANIGIDGSGIAPLILVYATSSVEYDFSIFKVKRGVRQKKAPAQINPRLALTENLVSMRDHFPLRGTEPAAKSPSDMFLSPRIFEVT